MNNHLIKVIDGPTLWEKSVPTVVGAITASALIEKGTIPHYEEKNESGYQRKPKLPRIKELAESLKKQKADLPTAVLLSIRHPAEEVLIKDGSMRELDLSRVDHLYVVDGQHRLEAIRMVLKSEHPLPPTFKVPFVCMLGTDENYEMKQFHVVNSKNRPVSTDLALGILKKRAASDPRLMDDLVKKGDDWKVEAMKLIKLLADTSRIWQGRIRSANMDKAATTIPTPSMVESLAPLLKSNHLFRAAPAEKQVQILNAYWGGIEKVFPEAFALQKAKGENGYEKYTLQKGVSVRILHGIFNNAMDVVRSRGESIFSSEVYAEVLTDPILEIEAHNGHGELAKGKEFWRVGKDGCIANYSGAMGTNLLMRMVVELLPKPSYEE